MIKLEILEKSNYIFKFKDDKNNIYSLNLEFFDIEEEPKVGDYIYMSAELLNQKYAGYSTNYTFGDLDSKYGKENLSLNDIDVIKLEIKDSNKEIYLKRLYG